MNNGIFLKKTLAKNFQKNLAKKITSKKIVKILNLKHEKRP